jgi:mannose/fructose/N-acetylgalactosamine-specific phosphotransferase system component IIC
MTPARKKLLVALGYAITLLLCYGLLSAPNLSWAALLFYGFGVGKWLLVGLLALALLAVLVRFVKWVWNWDSPHQKG